MKRISPSQKSLIACLLFIIFGLVGWFLSTSNTMHSLPLLLYYAVLVFNTFFSIRAFSAITPRNSAQTAFDMVLVGIYCALAFSFASTVYFALFSALLFLVAVAKYVHLRKLIASSTLLERKIRIDVLGALLSVATLCIAVAGWPLGAAWILCIVFALASVYLLLINPMYRVD